jgi:hypothetical protein
MLLRQLLQSYETKRKMVAPAFEGLTKRFKGSASKLSFAHAGTKDANVASYARGQFEGFDEGGAGSSRNVVQRRRGELNKALERMARYGFISDAVIFQLHANHVEELDEDRWELRQLEQKLLASMRRLAALFPEPPAPEPEPEAPPTAKHYPRASSMFDQARPHMGH